MAASPSVNKNAVTTKANSFVANVERARDLYRKIVLHGYTGSSSATSKKPNKEARDAARTAHREPVLGATVTRLGRRLRAS